MAKPKQRAGTQPRPPAAAAQPAAGQAAPGQAGPAKSAAGKAAAGKAAAGKAAAGKAAAGAAGRKPGPRMAAPARPLASVAEPVPLPRSVRISVRLMYVGAALAALDLIATLATIGSARGELHRANPHWNAVQLTAGVHSLILSNVVSWILTIAVWLIMARTNQAGRAWARNVATVLSALSSLTFILYLNAPGSLIGKLLLAPMWLVGVAAATLLWRRESTAYIRAGVG
jgi:hypothetical protein